MTNLCLTLGPALTLSALFISPSASAQDRCGSGIATITADPCGSPPAASSSATLPNIVAFADARLRFERVEASLPADVSVLTLRLRPGVEISLNDRASVLAELEGVIDLSDRNWSDGRERRLVPDRRNLQLNRVQLNYAIGNGHVVAGRQRIELADERFVGSAGFRQNDQTYDGVRASGTTARGFSFDFSYIRGVNRFNSFAGMPSRFSGDSYLMNIGFATPVGRLTLFDYAMDLANREPPIVDRRASNQTFGASLLGSAHRSGVDIEWRADFARQHDFAGNPLRYRADYSRIKLKVDNGWGALILTREGLGSNGYTSFQTPLGSNHAFLGSAEVFVNPPPTGVVDRSVEAVLRSPALGSVRSVSVFARHHWFDASFGSAKLGAEWDFSISGQWSAYRISIEHARYNAASFGADTRRTWFTIARIF